MVQIPNFPGCLPKKYPLLPKMPTFIAYLSSLVCHVLWRRLRIILSPKGLYVSKSTWWSFSPFLWLRHKYGMQFWPRIHATGLLRNILTFAQKRHKEGQFLLFQRSDCIIMSLSMTSGTKGVTLTQEQSSHSEGYRTEVGKESWWHAELVSCWANQSLESLPPHFFMWGNASSLSEYSVSRFLFLQPKAASRRLLKSCQFMSQLSLRPELVTSERMFQVKIFTALSNKMICIWISLVLYCFLPE